MAEATKLTLETLADPDALARRVADWLLADMVARSGRYAVALSGGNTPRRLYELLAASPRRDRLPWDRAHWFFGDERFVPPDDPQSNYRMVREAMLSRAPIPAANIHPIPTMGIAPDAAALRYEQELQAYYGAARLDAARPLFDLVLLGLGTNGHTASLFPGSSALEERTRWAASVEEDKNTRITLTYPVLESCRAAAFLVTGAEKRDMLARLRRGDQSIPAGRLQPKGALLCFADAAAMEA